jgi:Tol biopolymer transport system component
VICGEVWVMGSDGSDARPLLSSQPVVTGLDWSPDGERIVYGLEQHMSCEGREGLWTMKPDGSDQRSLEAPLGRAPSWSPDGTTIAFDDWRNTCHACGEIWLMDADGSDQRPLVAEQDRSNWAPAWSPEGSRVAFERSGDGASELWTVHADGSNASMLANRGWTPDW